MTDRETSFNPKMLLLARESRAVTQSDLADRASTTQSMISKIENSLEKPDSELVASLARALGYPPSFFFQDERVHGLPVSFYRKRKQMSRRLLAEIEAQVSIRALHVRRLLKSAELVSDKEIPEIDVESRGETPEDIAQTIRAWWGVPRGPITNLVSLIESMGGIVVPCPFNARDIDAIGQRIPEIRSHPLFFVNDSIPTDRLRFTLAHELGHVIMHCYPNPDADQMEKEADRFAGEFLMPEADIRPDLRGLSIPKLASLKPIWRVSMGALLMRANALGVVPQGKYRYLWRQMGRLGYRTNEPAELALPPERPTALGQLVDFHLERLNYSESELARALNELPDGFERKYRRSERPLRLVSVEGRGLTA